MERQYLCVLGSCNLDQVLRVAEFPRPGETVSAQSYARSFGGKGANQALAAQCAGVPVHFVSLLGEETAAQAMRYSFIASGMDVAALRMQKKVPTGLAMIQVNQHGENEITLVHGANALLTAAYVREHQAVIAGAKALLMQLETPLDGVLAAAEIASKAGVPIILNPAPACDLPAALYPHLALITPNETEAQALTGIPVTTQEGAEAAANQLLSWGVQAVLITLGSKGVYFADSETRAFYPTFATPVVDTTGAGDTCVGALVAARLAGKSMPQAIRFAQAAASLAVSRAGAQTAIPTLAEINLFLANHPQ